jgi:hypothetical protein
LIRLGFLFPGVPDRSLKICGVSALVGTAMLRIAETDDARLRAAVRVCGLGLGTLGAGLLPAGLGDRIGHPLAQLSLAIGSAVGIALVARGVGQLQGRDFPVRWLAVLAVALGAVCTSAWLVGPLRFLLNWLGRGFVLSPRDLVERGLGLSLAAHHGVPLASRRLYGGRRGSCEAEPSVCAQRAETGHRCHVRSDADGHRDLAAQLVNAQLRQQLRNRAITDELTGTMTRRALGELALAAIDLAQRRQHAVAVLMLDLDHSSWSMTPTATPPATEC